MLHPAGRMCVFALMRPGTLLPLVLILPGSGGSLHHALSMNMDSKHMHFLTQRVPWLRLCLPLCLVRQGSGYPYDDDDDARQPRDSPERRWWAHFRTGVRAAAAEMQAAGWLPAEDVESAESYLFLGLPGGDRVGDAPRSERMCSMQRAHASNACMCVRGHGFNGSVPIFVSAWTTCSPHDPSHALYGA